jgi:sugar phosphate isomerase/epimerase
MQPEMIPCNQTDLQITKDIKLKYIYPFWGQEHLDMESFIDEVPEKNFDGIDINLPEKGIFTESFIYEIDDISETNPDFVFIAQQLTSPINKKVGAYIKQMKKKLLELIALRPPFINSHTGKDYFSFEDNCRVIEACMNISSKTGTRILHETHRSRFSFHAATLLPYLKKFPELELVGDFAHFCTVSESMLQDQEEIIEQIVPHVSYIHVRVGHDQSPQVNDLFAPEWQTHFNRFAGWWQDVIYTKVAAGCKNFTITPEYGPFPYMPQIPFTLAPACNQ